MGWNLCRHRRCGRWWAGGCATCSTRRSATTRRWCRWSTSTRSAPAAARSRTSTREASSARPSRPGPTWPGLLRPRQDQPTSIDAQLVLGRLRPDQVTGSHGPRIRARSRRAHRGRRLDMTVEEAALGAPDPEVRHDAGHRAELGPARLRPARLHACRGGRRGPHCSACDIALERSTSARPGPPGIVAATGLLATDLQHEFVATELVDWRSTGSSSGATTNSSPRHRAARRTAFERTGGSSAASPIAATRARATRCASTFRRARSTTRGWKSWRNASTRLTRPSTATGSTRKSRSSTCARSRSGVWTPRAVGAGAGRW